MFHFNIKDNYGFDKSRLSDTINCRLVYTLLADLLFKLIFFILFVL